jgi:hypothetical protein
MHLIKITGEPEAEDGVEADPWAGWTSGRP